MDFHLEGTFREKNSQVEIVFLIQHEGISPSVQKCLAFFLLSFVLCDSLYSCDVRGPVQI